MQCNTCILSQISTVQETVASISCRDLCSHLIRFVQLFFLWHVIIRCFNSLLVLHSEQYSSFLVSSLVSSILFPITITEPNPNILAVVAPEAACTIDAKYWRAACRGELRSTIRYSPNFPCENWSRDANGGEFICAGRLQRFLF